MQLTTKSKIQRMCVTAVLIALAAVLSEVKIFTMPTGGSITLLSMLPIVMIPLMFGTAWGLAGAFIYSVLQLLLDVGKMAGWGLSAGALTADIFLDFIIAFTVLGLAGLFRKKGIVGIICGVVLALALRFLCHFLAGVVVWGSVVSSGDWIYSLSYNASYMVPEIISTTIAAIIVFQVPQIKKFLDK